MPPPSLARSFFEQIVDNPDPVAAILRLIDPDNPTFETDWLDFKGEHQSDPRQREKSNRSYWSEYLTAFANTGGGVLIWGVDARRVKVNGREIDFAGSEVPVNDPVGLASKLNEWQGQATNPPLSGVEIKPYTLPDKPNEGFVVCYVPQGSLRPYQSLQTPDKQYYLRGGGSNFVMDRAVLASMFYPRSHAVFRVRAKLEFVQPRSQDWVPGTPLFCKIMCRIEFINDGTATAREIVTRLTWRAPGTKSAIRVIGGDCLSNEDNGCAFTLASPIHPGFWAEVLYTSWMVEKNAIDRNVKRGFTWGDIPPQIELEIFCENQAPQTIAVPFILEELATKGKLEVEAKADGWSDG